MKSIKSDKESRRLYTICNKSIGDMNICGDLENDILHFTPDKWEKFL